MTTVKAGTFGIYGLDHTLTLMVQHMLQTLYLQLIPSRATQNELVS